MTFYLVMAYVEFFALVLFDIGIWTWVTWAIVRGI